jgi:hypothetical protein
MRRLLLAAMLAALATAVLGAAPAGAAVYLEDEAVGWELETGDEVKGTSTNFMIETGFVWIECGTAQLSGKVAAGPEEGDQVLTGVEGAGEVCVTNIPGMGKFNASVERIALGTVDFFNGGLGSFSKVEVDAALPFLGANCKWKSGGSEGSTWWAEGKWPLGGGFGLNSTLAAGTGCPAATVKGDFGLNNKSNEFHPVHIRES